MLKSLKHFFFASSLLLLISGAAYAQTGSNFGTFSGNCFQNSAVIAVNACLKRQEAANIKPHSNIASRKGDQLCLNTQQGKAKCLRTSEVDNSSEYVRYFFMGVLPNQPIAAVYSIHYEWDELQFFSLVDGKELYTRGNVQDTFISPDERHILITQADEMSGVFVEILPISATQPWAAGFKADADALKELAPLAAQWVSNEEVLIQLGALDAKELTEEMRVKFDGKKWQSTIKKK